MFDVRGRFKWNANGLLHHMSITSNLPRAQCRDDQFPGKQLMSLSAQPEASLAPSILSTAIVHLRALMRRFCLRSTIVEEQFYTMRLVGIDGTSP